MNYNKVYDVIVVSVLNIDCYSKIYDIDIEKVYNISHYQDIIHSIYCTHTDLKSLVYDNNSNKCIELVVDIISTCLRPFMVKWHPIFFKPISSTGIRMSTSPKRFVSRKLRKEFNKSFVLLTSEIDYRLNRQSSYHEYRDKDY